MVPAHTQSFTLLCRPCQTHPGQQVTLITQAAMGSAGVLPRPRPDLPLLDPSALMLAEAALPLPEGLPGPLPLASLTPGGTTPWAWV